LSPQDIELLRQKFVPAVFNTVNKSLPQDKKIWTEVFYSWVKRPGHPRTALPLEARLPGTQTLFFFAAGGQPLKINPALGNMSVYRRLQEVLTTFGNLPEADRAPAGAKEMPDLSQLKYASGGGRYKEAEPPPGRLMLRVYSRPLMRDQKGQYRVARVNHTQVSLVDPNCFEGTPKFKNQGSVVLEPTRDTFWLTEAEWQSLVPADPQEGERLAVPRSASRRLLLYGCQNWWASETATLWGSAEAFKQGDLTATVAEVSPTQITLNLQGEFLLTQVKPYNATFKGRVMGMLRYDRGKKAFGRFDLVVLGDYQGMFMFHPNKTTAGPLPMGYAFELARSDNAADSVVPLGMSLYGKRYLETGSK
jgi:hypothetical protein